MNRRFFLPGAPFRRAGACVLVLLASAVVVLAQEDRATPLLSGTVAFVTNVDGGHAEVQPVFAPVLLVPIRQNWLIESRAEFEGDFERKDNGAFGGPVGSEVQYLQLDYIANKYVTVSAGRFLTPFGIYNERLYPLFIRNFQQEPFTLGLVGESSDGAMLRGGFAIAKGLNLTYATFFSTLSTLNKFESDRAIGGRASFYLPKRRFEIGASWQHLLQEEHTNTYGAHMAWQPYSAPFDLRAEYVYDSNGKAYWLESAYKLSSVPLGRNIGRHTQLVARLQQFFAGTDVSENDVYELPDVRTSQVEGGLNYYFRDDIRMQASFGRSFSIDGNRNIWSVGATYRFAMPLWPGAW